MRFRLTSITQEGPDSFFTYVTEDNQSGIQLQKAPGSNKPKPVRVHHVTQMEALNAVHAFERQSAMAAGAPVRVLIS